MEHLPAYRMCLGNVCELDDPFTPLYKKLSDPFSIMFGFTSTLLRSKQVSSEVFNRTMALRPKLCERVFSRKAPFLMESVEAACDMLRICTERLHPSNVLQYLPWRFFLYFS
jgi:hypothetical protein